MANHPNRSKKFGPRDVALIAEAVNSYDILIQQYPFPSDAERNAHRLKYRNAGRALERLRMTPA